MEEYNEITIFREYAREICASIEMDQKINLPKPMQDKVWVMEEITAMKKRMLSIVQGFILEREDSVEPCLNWTVFFKSMFIKFQLFLSIDKQKCVLNKLSGITLKRKKLLAKLESLTLSSDAKAALEKIQILERCIDDGEQVLHSR